MIRQKIKVALIGNPNTGKTSLLNALTGMGLHIGNWPGKTVEKKEGVISFKKYDIDLVDLPGIYSISPYSEEEKIARDFIISNEADIVIQIIDVNALSRNLLLTFELLALNKKVILAFNFNEEAKKRGNFIQTQKIKSILKLPIVEIEANIGKNKKKLLTQILVSSKAKNSRLDYLKKLINSRNEISHQRVMNFVQKKIEPLCKTVVKDKKAKDLDKLLLNKYLALPIFFIVIFFIFQVTFSLSAPFMNWFNQLSLWLSILISNFNLPLFLSSFLRHGLIGGVFSVLSFTPLLFIMFLFIALLEDSGYLARTVILTDRLLQKFGLSGQSFIPMILGFGCNVPAITASRIIKNKKERLISILINPFMSCSARLSVYALFASAFFPRYPALIVMFLYLSGVVIALGISLFLSKAIKSKKSSTLIIELPSYRWPTVKTVLRTAWLHTYLFIKKAGTIILIAVIIVWLLASLPIGVSYGSEFSLLGYLGRILTPLFKPLGFGQWPFTVALIFGVISKEVIIGILGTLYGATQSGLTTVLSSQISSAGAIAFLIFVLLYTPCLATIAVTKKETGSWKIVIAQFLSTLIIAWILSFVIYNIVLIFGSV